ncbi:MAG TPA: hypothetical protein VGR43_03115, partial [Dehalococcoidia bacterium]|nr:hypothetical protein [Dehalococcoidia bacterium]
GPTDEYEALRAQLLAAIRRNPGDRRTLLREATALTRIMVAEHRLSPKRMNDLSDNLAAILDRFRDIIMPERDGG